MKTRCLKLIAFWAVLGLVVTVYVAGCNTVEGVGEDIQAVGEGTSDLARDAKD